MHALMSPGAAPCPRHDLPTHPLGSLPAST